MLKLLNKPRSHSEVQEAISELVQEHDIAVIPCNKNKVPVVKWDEFKERVPTNKELSAWFKKYPNHLWGAVTGNQFVVVDLDTHKNADLKQWALTNLPFTPLKAKTRSGGEHWFYRSAPSLMNHQTQAGLDVRSAGGYVICAGEGYEWNWQSDEDFHVFSDLPELKEEHEKAIKSLMNTNEGGGEGWHNTALKWSAQRVAWGWDDDRILKECEELTQPGYTHEQTREEITIMLKGARDKDFGADRDDQPLKVLTMSQAFELEANKPQDYLGHGFISAGFRVFIIGQPKIGKSQFVLEALTTAAVGGDFLGYRWNKAHKVLWLQAEIRGSYVGERLKPLFKSFSPAQQGLLKKNFLWTDRGDFDIGSNYNRLQTMIKKTKPTIVAIDPMANFFTGDESMNSEVNGFLKMLNSLFSAEELGTTTPPAVFLIHHTRKGVKDTDGFEGARGASAMQGWMDSGIMMTRHEEGIKLTFELRNGPWPQNRVVKLDEDSLRFVEPIFVP